MPQNLSRKNDGDLPIIQGKHDDHQRRSGRGRIRAAVLIVVHLIIVAHITHFMMIGRSLSPVEPSESMYALELGHLNAGTILFGVTILSTALFGRFFCGWACHIVALQDLCSYMLKRMGIKLKPLRSRLLILVPFAVAFYMFLWPTVLRLWQGNPHPGLTNHLMTDAFWKTFPSPAVAVLTFLVCGGLIVYLLGNKGFCTYGCPYGAFFNIADRLAIGRIRVTDACQQCGQCTASCTSNVSVHSEVRDFGMVVDPNCLKCTDCISACPSNALYFGFNDQRSQENRTSACEVSPRRKSYDFSIVEEIFGLFITAMVVFAMRGLYDITPLLLSVALGVITAFIAIQCWRLFRVRDLRIQNWQLKRSSKITGIGKSILAALLVWFFFNAHSFLVQFHRYQGRHNLSQVELAYNELLFTQPWERLNDHERRSIDSAIKSLQISDRLGFKSVLEVKMGLALANMTKGETEQAEKYLREAYDCNPEAARDMLAEFLAAQGRQEEANKFLRPR